MDRIHIIGASGSGTTTLGSALANVLPHHHIDTDDYYWKVKYTEKNTEADRVRMLKQDLARHEKWILSGAVISWGNELVPLFDAVIFLSVENDERLERLRKRERGRYGEAILPGGRLFEEHKDFLDWAALYETAGMETRSRTQQEQWLKQVSCPVLRIDEICTVEEEVTLVLDWLQRHV